MLSKVLSTTGRGPVKGGDMKPNSPQLNICSVEVHYELREGKKGMGRGQRKLSVKRSLNPRTGRRDHV